jgi:hypothetical protein
MAAKRYARIMERITDLRSIYMLCDQYPDIAPKIAKTIRERLAGLIFALATKAVQCAPADEIEHANHVWSSWNKRITTNDY